MLSVISPKSKGRDKHREYERRSRLRRNAKLDDSRRTLDALERAVVVARTLGDDDGVWDDFLDADAARVRRYLLKSLLLTKEATALTRERAQLKRLLQEHELATQVLRAMVQDHTVDDWECNVEHWRGLAHRFFAPWTRDACQDEIDAALKEVRAFQWSKNKQTTGASFLGWSDLLRIDPIRGVFQYQFSKTFHGFDVIDYVNVVWDMYTTEALFSDIILGHRVRLSHEVLQQLGPNIMIVRTAERFDHISVDAHNLYLVFRVRTERGYLHCVRTLVCGELVQSIDGPRDVWPSNFFWFQWDLDDDNGQHYTLRTGGTMGGSDINYAKRWMMELASAVLRSERAATGLNWFLNDQAVVSASS